MMAPPTSPETLSCLRDFCQTMQRKVQNRPSEQGSFDKKSVCVPFSIVKFEMASQLFSLLRCTSFMNLDQLERTAAIVVVRAPAVHGVSSNRLSEMLICLMR